MFAVNPYVKDMVNLERPAFTAPSLYPSPSAAALKLLYVAKQIKDAQAPAAIIDRAVVKRNCNLMLEAAQKLGVGFRAHVKTHKVLLSLFNQACFERTILTTLVDH